MAGVLLGSGNGNLTLTVPVATAVPADGVLQLVCAIYWLGNPDAPNGNISGVTDTASLTWEWPNLVTQPPVIAPIQSLTSVSPFPVIQAQSAARACIAGDLAPGGSVTVTFNSSGAAQSVSPNAPAASAFESVGLLVYMPADYAPVTQFGTIIYGNGDSQPGVPGIGTFHSLDWTTDPVNPTTPDANAVMVAAMAASPGLTGFSPLEVGSFVGEEATANVSIACGVAGVLSGSAPNPGGVWTTDRDLLAGNYQYLEQAVAGGLYAWRHF